MQLNTLAGGVQDERELLDILGGEFVFLRDVGLRDSSPAFVTDSVVETCDGEISCFLWPRWLEALGPKRRLQFRASRANECGRRGDLEGVPSLCLK